MMGPGKERWCDLLRRVAIITLGLWWGGLTVYAWIAVPIAGEIFGAAEQGFVTQRVTHWLNALLAVAIVTNASEVLSSKRRWLIGTWIALLLSLIALVALHWHLDGYLDTETHDIEDRPEFYQWHRLYLWITAVQWVAGLACFWGVTGSTGLGATETGK